MHYVISLDWFQYFAHARVGMRLDCGSMIQGVRPDSSTKCPVYEICKAEEFHAIYRNSCTIKLRNFPICHVHWAPKSSALDPHSCTIKVANRLLYSSQWSFHLHNVCDALRLDVRSITRADICCDFIRFANGQLPNDFIHHYLRDSVGKRKWTYIRHGSNSFTTIGRKVMRMEDGSTELKAKTKIKSVTTEFNYLRFGTRNSGCSVYLYNKSLELKEQHGKPWIRQSWIDGGLIKESYEEGEEEPQVYRLELSLQAKGMNVRAKRLPNGDFCKAETIRKLAADDFALQANLEETFWAYQHKYFRFKVCTGQKYRKDMKDLLLFSHDLVPMVKPVYLNHSVDAGIAERNAASIIQRLSFKASMLSGEQRNTLLQACDILEGISLVKKVAFEDDLRWTLDEDKIKHASAGQLQHLRKFLDAYTIELLSIFKDEKFAKLVESFEAEESRCKWLLHDYPEGLPFSESSYFEAVARGERNLVGM